jgi:hypothetical protein
MSPAAGASSRQQMRCICLLRSAALHYYTHSVSFPSLRDYVFKRISLEVLLCRVGEEELLVCALSPKPSKPVVSIGQLQLLVPQHVLAASATNLNIGSCCCALRVLHVCGPHIFGTAPGSRRAQATPHPSHAAAGL